MRLFGVKLFLGICFITLIFLFRYSFFNNIITFDMLRHRQLEVLHFIKNYYTYSVLFFIGTYIIIVVLALPFAALWTVMGGFLFGLLPAVIYANIAATIGATLFFLIVRFVLGNTLQKRYQIQLQRFNNQMDKYGIYYLIAIHFIAVIPFFVINLLIGLTNVSTWTFIWTTAVGILPGSFVYAFAGRQLGAIASMKDIFSINILIAFGLLLLLALIPFIVHRCIELKKS